MSGRDPRLSSDRVALQAEIAALAPWFHNIDLGGVQAAPDHFPGSERPPIDEVHLCRATDVPFADWQYGPMAAHPAKGATA